MLKNLRPVFRSALIILAFLALAVVSAKAGAIRFRVKLDASMAKPGELLSGRLLIFMTARTEALKMIEPDFTDTKAVWITGMEVVGLAPNKSVTVDADTLSFPGPFSAAPEGDYQIMALLDRDHSYTYDGAGAGDILSSVVKAKMPAAETELVLSNSVPEPQPAIYPPNVKIIDFESPALSRFWGRPIKIQASVVLPPDYDKSKQSRFPTVYSVHGYGGDNLKSLRGVPNLLKEMTDGKRPQMIYVYLNAHCPLGHHVFADSANNGPWGQALTIELIPYLEKQFRMDARPSGRFLTGHSSGGWTSLWLQVAYPDVFGGTWSTSPDPVDFRSFTGPDLSKYPPQNAYTNAGGKPYNLVRMGGKELMTVEEYAKQEHVLGYYGGQFASFNAVFSPKGDDGQPMPLFDVETGRIDPFVQKAWEKYDISLILRNNWKTLGPKLKGKLHIIVGTADTFHLDEAVRLLDAELKKLGSDAKFEYLPGKNHFDLYNDGLGLQIAREMYAVARPGAKAAAK
jgi:enterochelin esterase-like enzyme